MGNDVPDALTRSWASRTGLSLTGYSRSPILPPDSLPAVPDQQKGVSMMRHRWKTLILSGFFLIACVCSADGGERRLRILHVNDFHGFAEAYTPYGETEKRGGVAYLAALAEKRRAEMPSLFLAAGDMIQGSNWANHFRGVSVIEAMNVMRVDAMVVGNHEFDFGRETLTERIREAAFPVLGANVAGLEGLPPYVIRDVGGVKIGIIGVVAEDTPVATHPRNVAGLTFLPPAAVVRRYLGEVRKQAQVIVILSHLGFPADRQLARDVPGIDIIVGGHSHTRLAEPVRVGGTTIVQAFEHGKVLGVLDLTVDGGVLVRAEGKLEDIIPAAMPADEHVAAIVARRQRTVDAAMNETIGETRIALDGEHVRVKETNLGDLIADVVRATTGADAAIVNGGGIRRSVPAGKITVGTVYDVVPHDNYLVAVKLTGKQIRDTLEHGVSAVEEARGRFPHVSGIRFRYSPSAPPGARVREVAVAGAPLDPDKLYVVGTIDFLAAGGDGFTAFGEAVRSSGDYAMVGGAMKGEKLVYSDAGNWLRDILVAYIKTAGTITEVPMGRIEEGE